MNMNIGQTYRRLENNNKTANTSIVRCFVALMLLSFVSTLYGQEEEQKEKVARPDIPGELMVDVGFNFWSEEPLFVDQSFWRSKSVSVYYIKRKLINEKLSFYYGLGIGSEKIDFGDSLTLVSGVVDGDDIIPVELTSLDDDISYDKNRLAVSYVDVPLELRFHPLGTKEGEGLFIGAGTLLGVRFNSHMKLKYDQGGETVIEKIKGNYNLPRMRYGVQARLGFRGIHLFYKRYFGGTFKDDLGDNEVNPEITTIGINFTGF